MSAAGRASGVLTETVHTLRSKALQNERPVWVREPRDRARADHVVVFLDGEFYRDRVGANDVINASASELADAWFVFVSMHSPDARWVECPCHPPFAHFIARELLPSLEQRHPQLALARRRTLAGLSYTGLAAAFIAREFPGVFQQVISQSGSFWWNDGWLMRAFRDAETRLPTAFHLEVGTHEVQHPIRHRPDVLQTISQIEGVRQFRDTLQQLGHPVHYTEFDGGHQFEAWRKTLPAALHWALPLDDRPRDIRAR